MFYLLLTHVVLSLCQLFLQLFAILHERMAGCFLVLVVNQVWIVFWWVIGRPALLPLPLCLLLLFLVFLLYFPCLFLFLCHVIVIDSFNFFRVRMHFWLCLRWYFILNFNWLFWELLLLYMCVVWLLRVICFMWLIVFVLIACYLFVVLPFLMGVLEHGLLLLPQFLLLWGCICVLHI
jgi:hypothetical protein